MSVLENENDYLVHGVWTHCQKYHSVKAKSSVFQNSARITANGELQSYAFLQGERSFVTADTELERHFVEIKIHVLGECTR